MKPSEILDKAAEYCARGWCQGWFAIDEDGEDTWARDPHACKWCALGGVFAAVPPFSRADVTERYLCRVIGEVNIDAWNDTEGRTQAEVVQALRDAAELARRNGE